MVLDAHLFAICHKNRKLKKEKNLKIIVNLSWNNNTCRRWKGNNNIKKIYGYVKLLRRCIFKRFWSLTLLFSHFTFLQPQFQALSIHYYTPNQVSSKKTQGNIKLHLTKWFLILTFSFHLNLISICNKLCRIYKLTWL